MISPWVYHPTTKAVHTSISGCQRAIGLRGYVSISLQWSRPRLSASFPTLHTPITSLCPTLKVQKWQLMEAGAWVKMLQEKKKTTRVLTDHSPWRRWAGWSGQCSLEERRKRWPRCTRGSECCALSTSFSSSASGLRTSGTPSHMDLPRETWCDHPGIIRKVFFFSCWYPFSTAFSEPTWSSCDVHCFEISCFDHGDGEPASRGQITQREHQLPKVHVLLKFISEIQFSYSWTLSFA